VASSVEDEKERVDVGAARRDVRAVDRTNAVAIERRTRGVDNNMEGKDDSCSGNLPDTNF